MDSKYRIIGDAKHVGELEEFESTRPLNESERAHLRWGWIMQGVLFFTSVMFFVRGYIYSRPTTKIFVDEFSTYSPVSKAVAYSDVLFNASTSTAPPSSQYIGRGLAVDAAWENLSSFPGSGSLMINEHELQLLEKPKTSAKISDPSTGRSGYRVSLEVFHQLRCLDIVRKATWGEADEDMTTIVEDDEGGAGWKVFDGARWRGEVDHCLEILRMNLMCQADIGLVTFNEALETTTVWADGVRSLKPDFSTWHTCRNFDGIVEWTKQNAVDETKAARHLN